MDMAVMMGRKAMENLTSSPVEHRRKIPSRSIGTMVIKTL
jgi:hypothetical protein